MKKVNSEKVNGEPAEQALSEEQKAMINAFNQLIEGVKRGEILAFGAVCAHGHGPMSTSLAGSIAAEFLPELITGAGNLEQNLRATLAAVVQQHLQANQSKIIKPPAGWQPPPPPGGGIILD